MGASAHVDRSRAAAPVNGESANYATGTPVDRIRVAHLVYRFQEGGMERGVLKIVNGLPRTAIESSICSTVPATYLKDFVEPDVALFDFQRRRGNDPIFVWRLHRFLKRHRPHILHTHSWGTLCEGLVAARFAGVPVVIHGEHGTLQTKNYQLRVQRWAWGRADRLLAVSSRLADRMSAAVNVPRAAIQVIRNGVDAQRFQKPQRLEARLSLGVPADMLVVGTVGRLVDVKDHLALIEACRLLASDDIRFQCLIVGEGPLRPELEARIAVCGLQERVKLLGQRPNVDRVLAAFDVFVLASKSEGLSNTILEAMASGVAVVATRVGGADELIEDGHSGLLVEPKSPGDLARAIAGLAQNREYRAQIAAAGRARAERDFSLDAMVAAYERLYLDVARERGLLRGPRQPLRAATGT